MISGRSGGSADPLVEEPFFATLVDRSRQTNGRRTQELLDVVACCQGRGETSPDERERLAELAHQIVGSAGTFGFTRVSEHGRHLERVLADAGTLGAAELAELRRLGEAMLADLHPL